MKQLAKSAAWDLLFLVYILPMQMMFFVTERAMPFISQLPEDRQEDIGWCLQLLFTALYLWMLTAIFGWR